MKINNFIFLVLLFLAASLEAAEKYSLKSGRWTALQVNDKEFSNREMLKITADIFLTEQVLEQLVANSSDQQELQKEKNNYLRSYFPAAIEMKLWSHILEREGVALNINVEKRKVDEELAGIYKLRLAEFFEKDRSIDLEHRIDAHQKFIAKLKTSLFPYVKRPYLAWKAFQKKRIVERIRSAFNTQVLERLRSDRFKSLPIAPREIKSSYQKILNEYHSFLEEIHSDRFTKVVEYYQKHPELAMVQQPPAASLSVCQIYLKDNESIRGGEVTPEIAEKIIAKLDNLTEYANQLAGSSSAQEIQTKIDKKMQDLSDATSLGYLKVYSLALAIQSKNFDEIKRRGRNLERWLAKEISVQGQREYLNTISREFINDFYHSGDSDISLAFSKFKQKHKDKNLLIVGELQKKSVNLLSVSKSVASFIFSEDLKSGNVGKLGLLESTATSAKIFFVEEFRPEAARDYAQAQAAIGKGLLKKRRADQYGEVKKGLLRKYVALIGPKLTRMTLDE